MLGEEEIKKAREECTVMCRITAASIKTVNARLGLKKNDLDARLTATPQVCADKVRQPHSKDHSKCPKDGCWETLFTLKDREPYDSNDD